MEKQNQKHKIYCEMMNSQSGPLSASSENNNFHALQVLILAAATYDKHTVVQSIALLQSQSTPSVTKPRQFTISNETKTDLNLWYTVLVALTTDWN